MKKVIIKLILLVILALLAAGSYYWWRGRGVEPEAVPLTPTIIEPEEEQFVAPPAPEADPFEHDKDKDGIIDEEEERLGTSDLEFDTDHDGLSDIKEIEVWGTDPTKVDTDGDGYGDAIEIINGYNPLGEGRL